MDLPNNTNEIVVYDGFTKKKNEIKRPYRREIPRISMPAIMQSVGGSTLKSVQSGNRHLRCTLAGVFP